MNGLAIGATRVTLARYYQQYVIQGPGAFVEMATDEEAQKAASEFNQYQMGGRPLTVNEARPKPEGGFGGGGGGYGGNRGGGGGGRREPRW